MNHCLNELIQIRKPLDLYLVTGLSYTVHQELKKHTTGNLQQVNVEERM